MSVYNFTKPGAALLGHWTEERVLKEDGLAVRVTAGKGAVDSFERVMPRCRTSSSAASWSSVSTQAQACVLQPSQAPSAPPRGAAAAAAIAREAEAYVQGLTESRLAALRATEQPLSETQSRYAQAYDRDAYQVAQGLVAERSARRAPSSPTVAEQAAALGATARPAAYAASHYSQDAPVTSFSARLPELVFPYAFSCAGQAAAGKAHAEALYGGRGALENVPAHLLAPGAELSLAPLLTRLQRRLAEAGLLGGLPELVGRLQEAVAQGRLVQAADARAGGGSILGARQAAHNPHQGDPAFVRADVFRLFFHSLRTQLSDVDLEAVVRMASPVAAAGRAEGGVHVVSLALLEKLEGLAASARQ
jgi:hypothetical protein